MKRLVNAKKKANTSSINTPEYFTVFLKAPANISKKTRSRYTDAIPMSKLILNDMVRTAEEAMAGKGHCADVRDFVTARTAGLQ